MIDFQTLQDLSGGAAEVDSTCPLLSNRPFRVKHFQTIRRCEVSMSLTGSRFSSESAPRPFHYGISRMRWSNLCSGLAVRRNGRSKRDMRTHLIHRPARDIIHRSVELEDFLLLDLIL